VIHLAREPAVSQFQSVFTQCVESQLGIASHGIKRWIQEIEDLFGQDKPCDIRWIEPILFNLLSSLTGDKHEPPTVPTKQIEVLGRARVIVVGDWATGLKQARNVANAIKAQLENTPPGVDTHVIHLGDTYYSGLQEEYQTRFLPLWPVDEASTVGSWSLNGNHDMYSGGKGYFDVLLADPRFKAQERSSMFSLRTPNWQIVGLDSSYVDPDKPQLAADQIKWLGGLMDDAPAKTMLLSHHQPFSAYEDVESPLAGNVGEALNGRRVAAWLWGHEHRCTVYKPGIQFDAYDQFADYCAIVGHGGVPQLLSGPPPTPPAKPVDPKAIAWEFKESYTVAEDTWLLGGFAVLDFDGADLSIQYYDETGAARAQPPDHL
jgi:hypothetical protein